MIDDLRTIDTSEIDIIGSMFDHRTLNGSSRAPMIR